MTTTNLPVDTTRLVLEFIDGDERGRFVAVMPPRALIGMDASCHIVVVDAKARASAVHSELALDGAVWVIRDLGSTNGTLVSGRRIEASVVLRAGTEVRLGKGGPAVRVHLGTDITGCTNVADETASGSTTGLSKARLREAITAALGERERGRRWWKWMIPALLALVVVLTLALWPRTTAVDPGASSDSDRAALAAKHAARSVFTLLAHLPDGTVEPYCTGFAVNSSGLMVTNAHCAAIMRQLADERLESEAVMNEVLMST